MECTRQCSQWNILNEIAKVKGSQHPSLLLESSWRIGDWTTMKDVLSQVIFLQYVVKLLTKLKKGVEIV